MEERIRLCAWNWTWGWPFRKCPLGSCRNQQSEQNSIAKKHDSYKLAGFLCCWQIRNKDLKYVGSQGSLTKYTWILKSYSMPL